jgi:hypothetical protein
MTYDSSLDFKEKTSGRAENEENSFSFSILAHPRENIDSQLGAKAIATPDRRTKRHLIQSQISRARKIGSYLGNVANYTPKMPWLRVSCSYERTQS